MIDPTHAAVGIWNLETAAGFVGSARTSVTRVRNGDTRTSVPLNTQSRTEAVLWCGSMQRTLALVQRYWAIDSYLGTIDQGINY